MQTTDDIWEKFATQEELAEAYLKLLNKGFNDMQQKIIEYYGYERQLSKLVEEMRELEQAILYKNDEKHIKEEMADVLNLIEQIVHFRQWEADIYNIKYYKVQRQIKRIKNENLKNASKNQATNVF